MEMPFRWNAYIFIILCFNGNYVESRNFEEPIIEKESAHYVIANI
jgi:hypothetical protein